MAYTATAADYARPMTREEKKVIFASSLGTVFEWYDFYLYGSLSAVIAAQFFSGVNPTAAFIFALMAFAAGFAVRPVRRDLLRPARRPDRAQVHLPDHHHDHGALDLHRRHPAELRRHRHRRPDHPDLPAPACRASPSAASTAAPPPTSPSTPRTARRGAYTSWIQTTATLGLFLSLLVILGCRALDVAGGLRRLGLAHPVPGLDRAARHLGLDPADAEREPRLPADEGGGHHLQGAAEGELRPSGRTSRSCCSRSSASSPARRWSGTPASSTRSSS